MKRLAGLLAVVWMASCATTRGASGDGASSGPPLPTWRGFVVASEDGQPVCKDARLVPDGDGASTGLLLIGHATERAFGSTELRFRAARQADDLVLQGLTRYASDGMSLQTAQADCVARWRFEVGANGRLVANVGPFFQDQTACYSARAFSGVSLQACAEELVLPPRPGRWEETAAAQPNDASRHLGELLEQRGRIFTGSDTDTRSCRAWQLGDGKMRWQQVTANGWTEYVEYGMTVDGSRLALLGPTMGSLPPKDVEPKELPAYGESGTGCTFNSKLSAGGEEYLLVNQNRWFYSQVACEQALNGPQPILAGIPDCLHHREGSVSVQ